MCSLITHAARDKTHVEPSRKLHSALLKFSALFSCSNLPFFSQVCECTCTPTYIHKQTCLHTHSLYLSASLALFLFLSVLTRQLIKSKTRPPRGTCTWLRLGNFRAFYCARRVKNKAPKSSFFCLVSSIGCALFHRSICKRAAAEIWRRAAPDEIFTLAPADFDFWSWWWWIQKVRACHQSVFCCWNLLRTCVPHRELHTIKRRTLRSSASFLMFSFSAPPGMLKSEHKIII